jgi:hypothetical protein
MDSPPFFTGAKNMCDFSKKNRRSRPRCRKKKVPAGKKKSKKFSKSKNPSIFELPDPKIGGVRHFGSG